MNTHSKTVKNFVLWWQLLLKQCFKNLHSKSSLSKNTWWAPKKCVHRCHSTRGHRVICPWFKESRTPPRCSSDTHTEKGWPIVHGHHLSTCWLRGGTSHTFAMPRLLHLGCQLCMIISLELKRESSLQWEEAFEYIFPFECWREAQV